MCSNQSNGCIHHEVMQLMSDIQIYDMESVDSNSNASGRPDAINCGSWASLLTMIFAPTLTRRRKSLSDGNNLWLC